MEKKPLRSDLKANGRRETKSVPILLAPPYEELQKSEVKAKST